MRIVIFILYSLKVFFFLFSLFLCCRWEEVSLPAMWSAAVAGIHTEPQLTFFYVFMPHLFFFLCTDALDFAASISTDHIHSFYTSFLYNYGSLNELCVSGTLWGKRVVSVPLLYVSKQKQHIYTMLCFELKAGSHQIRWDITFQITDL